MEIYSGIHPKAIKAVIYGPEGIGKTTFAAQFPEPLFIDTEDSTAFIDVRRFKKPTSWVMLLDQVKYVRDTPRACRTLVIDTADWAEKLCIQHVCARHNKDGLEGFDYGRGYTYAYEAFGELLNLLTEVIERGVNVVLTAHATMTRCEQPEEFGTYDRWELKLLNSPKCSISKMVKEWSDLLVFANYKTMLVKDDKTKKNKAQGGRRTMYTAHHPCWDAKNRWGLPEEAEFDYNVIAPHIYINSGAVSTPAPAPAIPPVGVPAQKPDTGNPVSAPAEAEPAPAPQEQLTINVNPNIPKALADLMISNQVTEEELRRVVSLKGYYPEETPVENYDPAFISGVLVGAWNQVFAMIMSERDLPF